MKKLFLLLLIISSCKGPQITVKIPTIIIKHDNYTILYDTIEKTPIWSEYILTKDKVKPPKRGEFICDDSLPCNLQQGNKCYKAVNKGLERPKYSIDKGHLSPYEDLGAESMLFTNISFQNSYFNQHQWVELENYVRKLAIEDDSLIVRTGVIFKDSVINGFKIPVFYWKRIIDHGDTLIYQMPNKWDDLSFDHYLINK
jgi:DNA/RNA endonuclease G (NUC1)